MVRLAWRVTLDSMTSFRRSGCASKPGSPLGFKVAAVLARVMAVMRSVAHLMSATEDTAAVAAAVAIVVEVVWV